jgi:hypothetical protein
MRRGYIPAGRLPPLDLRRFSSTNSRDYGAVQANVWVSNSYDNTVSKLRASDGACISPCTFTVPGASGQIYSTSLEPLMGPTFG